MNISKMNFKITEFKNDEINISLNCYIDVNNKVWFKAKEIASILEYKKPLNAIKRHVNINDKMLIETKFIKKPTVPETGTVEKSRKRYFINESGLYSLILRSKMPLAKLFKHWVTSEVLPSIRKNGFYVNNHHKKIKDNHEIITENDLHYETVNFIREKYPEAVLIPGLGENQDSNEKRSDAYYKGYKGGQPDLQIYARSKYYTSLVIEFKTPKGKGVFKDNQEDMKNKYIDNGAKYLLSNNAFEISSEIIEYMNNHEKYQKRKKYRESKMIIKK